MRSFIDSLFPKRSIIIRADSGVRHFDMSSRLQKFLVVTFGLLVLLTVASLATAYMAHREAKSKQHELQEVQEIYRTRLQTASQNMRAVSEELASYDRRFDRVSDELIERQRRLLEAHSLEQLLSARLQAARERIHKITAKRDAAKREYGNASDMVEGLQNSLEAEHARVEQLSVTLESVSETLNVATKERDDSIAEIEELRRKLYDREQAYIEFSNRQSTIMQQVEEATRDSLQGLEKLLRSTGLNSEALILDIRKSVGGSGGPFIPADLHDNSLSEDNKLVERASSVLSDLDRVRLMRIAAETLPLGNPVRARHRISSGYGYRKDPFSGRRAMHKGIDMAAPKGTPIYTTAEGRVKFAGRKRGYGKTVIIEHNYGFQTVYAHNSRMRVKVGQKVRRGQHIADVGSTGRSTGPHLHYEVRRYGKAFNPAKLVKAGKYVLSK